MYARNRFYTVRPESYYRTDPATHVGEWGKDNDVPMPERSSKAPLTAERSQVRTRAHSERAWCYESALAMLDAMPRRTRTDLARRVPVADLVRRMPRMTDTEHEAAYERVESLATWVRGEYVYGD